jgi:plasmid stabilization system protein ParE
VAKLHYTRRAREDLLDIWLYIAARNSEALADAIYDRIEESCAHLARHPQIGQARLAQSQRKALADGTVTQAWRGVSTFRGLHDAI